MFPPVRETVTLGSFSLNTVRDSRKSQVSGVQYRGTV